MLRTLQLFIKYQFFFVVEPAISVTSVNDNWTCSLKTNCLGNDWYSVCGSIGLLLPSSHDHGQVAIFLNVIL